MEGKAQAWHYRLKDSHAAGPLVNKSGPITREVAQQTTPCYPEG